MSQQGPASDCGMACGIDTYLWTIPISSSDTLRGHLWSLALCDQECQAPNLLLLSSANSKVSQATSTLLNVTLYQGVMYQGSMTV